MNPGFEQARAVANTSADVNALFWFLFWVCSITALLIFAFLIGFSIKYRKRPGYTQPQPTSRKRLLFEVLFIGPPLAMFLLFYVWGAKIYMNHMRAPLRSLEIYCIAKQWMWKFQHPQGQREINELHVPINQPVTVILTSQDVIHSFFVPAFRVKMDVVPGRYTQVWFKVHKPGRYRLFCSQYCGTWHARMRGSVIAMTPEQYQSWLQGTRQATMADQGRQLFERYNCIQCHGPGSAMPAPDLHGLFGRPVHLSDGQTLKADETYIRESIVNPGGQILRGYRNIMPTFKTQLSEADILDLIEYIKSLSGPGENPHD